MKEQVFVDSGFWIALLDRKDQNHPIATSHLKPLLSAEQTCFLLIQAVRCFLLSATQLHPYVIGQR